jgi:hypothetical protein
VKEPHGQGRASHPGPESCGEARKGVAEALTAGSAGERSSREITTSTAPALLGEAEDNTGGDAITSAGERGRSRSSSACTATPRAGTGGSHDPAGEDEEPERHAKAKGRTASWPVGGSRTAHYCPRSARPKWADPLCVRRRVWREGGGWPRVTRESKTLCGRRATNKARSVRLNGCERAQRGTGVRGAKVMHCWPGVGFDAMTLGKSQMWW